MSSMKNSVTILGIIKCLPSRNSATSVSSVDGWNSLSDFLIFGGKTEEDLAVNFAESARILDTQCYCRMVPSSTTCDEFASSNRLKRGYG